MTGTEAQAKLIAEAERLAGEARAVLHTAHGSLTSEQHEAERRLSYAYDCLSDAIGYLTDARSRVTPPPAPTNGHDSGNTR